MERMADKPDFKYQVEHALTVSCDWAGIVSPADLDTVPDHGEAPPSNIYLIARRPRIAVDPTSWFCDEETVRFTVVAQHHDGEVHRVTIEGPNAYGVKLGLMSDYPHTNMVFVDGEGAMLGGVAAGTFVAAFLRSTMDLTTRMSATDLDASLLDLEVVYVGQSPDENGAASSRLRNHSTLQSILARTGQQSPHVEVWVVLMRFASYNTLGQWGWWQGSAGEDASFQHLRRSTHHHWTWPNSLRSPRQP